MAVFRVEKTRNYTVMSNLPLQDRDLTLKAKGLMALLLSLPDNWDYTMRGLASICKENKDTVSKIIKELISAGYVTRHQERGESGQMGKSVYTIYESSQKNEETSGNEPRPKTSDTVKADTDRNTPQPKTSDTVKSDTQTPCTDYSAQQNTNILNTKKSNTDTINHSPETQQTATAESERMNDRAKKSSYRDYYNWIKENIDYSYITNIDNRQIKHSDDVERINEIVDVMVDMLYPESSMVRIGDGEFPHEVVKSRLAKITSEHVIYILDCLDRNTTKIINMSAYLRKTIYNAPTTYNNYVTSDVNNMLHGS
jgi:hypothetical protein